MSGKIPTYYWDSSIFYEYFRKEPATPQKKQAVRRLLFENKKRENVICTSALTQLECLPKKLNQEDVSREAKYSSLFQTRFFYDIPISSQIMNMARDIRDFYYVEGDPKSNTPYRMMGLGDAIHIATAISEGVTEFHTRDGKRSKGNIPLIGLDKQSPGGKIAGCFDLHIVSPEDPQLEMFSEELGHGE